MPDSGEETEKERIEVIGGTCFMLSRFENDAHYWFVLSNPEEFPDDDLVCVNVTSYDPKGVITDVYNDPSCVLYASDHELFTHTSCVCYEGLPDGRCSRHYLETQVNSSTSNCYPVPGPPASAGVLARMREGATYTQHLPFGSRNILRKQGLI